MNRVALVVKLVDTQDLKSCLQQCGCGFNSRLGHKAAKAAFFMRISGLGFYASDLAQVGIFIC